MREKLVGHLVWCIVLLMQLGSSEAISANESNIDPLDGCGSTIELFLPGSAVQADWKELSDGTAIPFPESMQRSSTHMKEGRLFTLSLTPSIFSIYDSPDAVEYFGSINIENMSIGPNNEKLTQNFLHRRNAGIGQVRIASPILSGPYGEGEVFYVTRSSLSTAKEGSKYSGSPEFVGWKGESESGYELSISGIIGGYETHLIANVEGHGRNIVIQSAHDGSGLDLSWEIDKEKRAALREKLDQQVERARNQKRDITKARSNLPRSIESIAPTGIPKPPPPPDASMLPDPSTFPNQKPRPTWLGCS